MEQKGPTSFERFINFDWKKICTVSKKTEAEVTVISPCGFLETSLGSGSRCTQRPQDGSLALKNNMLTCFSK